MSPHKLTWPEITRFFLYMFGELIKHRVSFRYPVVVAPETYTPVKYRTRGRVDDITTICMQNKRGMGSCTYSLRQGRLSVRTT